uniref:Uncharacterized protein n=1 Tax=Arundo donax TaxID=35708 RepID=A0A0A9HZN8_ARUDO
MSTKGEAAQADLLKSPDTQTFHVQKT